MGYYLLDNDDNMYGGRHRSLEDAEDLAGFLHSDQVINHPRIMLVCGRMEDDGAGGLELQPTQEMYWIKNKEEKLDQLSEYLPHDPDGLLILPKTKKGELIKAGMKLYTPDPGLDYEDMLCTVTSVDLRDGNWMVIFDTGEGWWPEDCYLDRADCEAAMMSGK